MNKFKCIDKSGSHTAKYFKTILRVEIDSQLSNAVRWCSECGICSLDLESDLRLIKSENWCVPMIVKRRK